MHICEWQRESMCVYGCLFAWKYTCMCFAKVFFQLTKYLPILPLHLLVSCFLVTENYVCFPRTSLTFLLPKESVSSILKDLFSKFICFVLCSTKFNSDHLCDHGLGTSHYTLIGSPMVQTGRWASFFPSNLLAANCSPLSGE